MGCPSRTCSTRRYWGSSNSPSSTVGTSGGRVRNPGDRYYRRNSTVDPSGCVPTGQDGFTCRSVCCSYFRTGKAVPVDVPKPEDSRGRPRRQGQNPEVTTETCSHIFIRKRGLVVTPPLRPVPNTGRTRRPPPRVPTPSPTVQGVSP